MTDTNQLPPHTITIHDHPEPHIMQWSDLELAAVKRYAEQYALQARAQVQGEPVTVAVDHFDNGPFEAYTNRIYPPVEIDTKLYTHPAPSVPADVARDAERYRWLRDHDHWPAPFSSSQEPEPVRGRDLDSNIDAAMLAAKDSK